MRKRRILRILLIVAAVLLSANWGLSLALHDGWARRSLLSRLSASFGRPVEVGYFDFNLLSGLRLEAHAVTVGEDPRFGSEYFLRAEQLTASPRWGQLLRGRFELGTLSIAGASLNLVRASDGDWNIESWLPAARPAPGGTAAITAATVAAGTGDGGAQPSQGAVRVAHIEIDTGRINFKREVEKLPFALVDVSGRLDQDSAGRWTIDLEALPARASVALQEAGTLRLRGTVAGTSAHLRPAKLTLSWQEASAADAIRLASGVDYGVRGTVAGEFSASIEDPPATPGKEPAGGWTLTGVLRFAGMHRWDLSAKATDPAFNVNVTAAWRPSDPRLELLTCVVSAPHSRVSATGELNWLRGFNPSLRVADSNVGLADLLAWRSAFFPGIASGLAADGTLAVEAAIAGWPPRINQLELDSPGATLRAGAVSAPVRFGHISAALQKGMFVLKPVQVDLPGVVAPAAARGTRAPVQNPSVSTSVKPSAIQPASQAATVTSGTLRIAGQLGPFPSGDWPGQWTYQVTALGETARVEDLLDVAAAFGRSPANGWTLEGPAALQLAWAGTLGHGAPSTVGTLKLRGIKLTSVLMNQPLVFSSATVDLRPGTTRIRIDDVQGLGARWKGSLEWRAVSAAWSFDLSADRLDAADLDRWLGPRARPSFFRRLLQFKAPSDLTPAREAALAAFRARGRLRVGDVALARLHFASLDADATVDGRNIVLRRAEADFYGGRMAGEFTAQLAAVPAYSFKAKVDRANLAAMTAETASLAGQFAGVAAGDLTLTARGIAANDLLASLAGEGELRIRDAVLRGIDFAPVRLAAAGDLPVVVQSRFNLATAKFHVAAGQVHVDEALFSGRDARLELVGDVDFARRLDLRVQSVSVSPETIAERDSDSGRDSWTVGGTLDSPQVTRQTRVARDRTGLPAARR